MIMTRKDYEALAEAIHKAKPVMFTEDMDVNSDFVKGYNLGSMHVWKNTVHNIIAELTLANSNFDRSRFRKACVYDD